MEKTDFNTGDIEFTGFCCLGVLADVEWPDDWYGEMLGFNDQYGDSETAEGELPVCLLNELELSQADQETLIVMNDGKAYNEVTRKAGCTEGERIDGTLYCKGYSPRSFAEIADYIEENL